MARLRLTLLGGFRAELAGRPVTAFESDQMRALLAYLAVEANRPHARGALAGLLWPDQPEERARTNLRHVLYELRRALGDGADGDRGESGFFLSTRQSIQFNPAGDYALDAARFVTLLAECDAHVHASLPTCAECMPRLSEAVALYGGNFLAGLNVSGSVTFEEWARVMQERLHRQALEAMHALASYAEAHGDLSAALRYARRQVELEPWREEAHQQLMRALALDGQRSAALAQFGTLRRLLTVELGVAPSAESVALHEQIRQGELKIVPIPLSAEPSPSQDRGKNEKLRRETSKFSIGVPDPGPLYGRQVELDQLGSWILTDRCRVVTVLGLGGMGKTALAAAFTRAHTHQFDRVVWRALVNAPPLEDVLSALLRSLSGQTLTGLPASLDDQLGLLLGYLRTQRCLIVLDNLETILQAEHAGAFRPGYEAYAQMLQHLAEHAHQSCLVLTSRERPSVFSRWDEDATAVCTLRLNGLDDAAARDMLSARGLSNQGADAVTLAGRYSGNPLALKLVAQTVHDLFGGDVASFLTIETPIFDDIRAVLDEQFARLSELERDVMVWLAIEREPTPFQTLHAAFARPVSINALVEALRGLQRRSLIDHSANGFSLQNVVLEYTTDLLVEQVCQEIDDSPSGNRKLNQFALLKAQAKEYVRASQARLILSPIVERTLAALGDRGLTARLKGVIAALQAQGRLVPGYAAGNIMNLLLHAGVDLRGYDFSGLNVWQAYLQGRLLPGVNFSGSNLTRTVFTHVFGDILAIRMGDDGQLLVAGLIEGKLCLRRAADGQLLREYQTLGAGASIASFSADGRMLASADTDNSVRVWDVESGALLHTLSGHPETPWAVAFNPDGSMLASSGAGGIVHLWDLQATHQPRQTLRSHAKAVQGLAFSADGRMLATGDVDGIVCVWRVGEPAPIYTLHGHTDVVHGLAFDATGDILASGSYDRTIRLWSVRDGGRLLQSLETHTRRVRRLVISSDGHTLASGGGDTFVCLWDITTGQLLHTLLGHASPLHHLAFSADGRTLVTVGVDQTVCLWDAATGERLDTLRVHSNQLFSTDFSPDGRMLVSGGEDGIVRLWNAGAANIVRSFQGHAGAIDAVAYNPKGTTFASAGRDRTIRLWDIRSGRAIHELTGHTDHVEALQFSPDGRQLVSGSHDQSVRIWDLQQGGQSRLTLRGHTDRIRSCLFSPDGRIVASCAMDRTIRLWDAQSGQLIRVLQGHASGVKGLAFSSDGRALASSSYDRTLRLWNVDQGEVMRAWPAQNTMTLSLSFHPDGHTLAAGATDYTVRLWSVSTGHLINTLRGHTNLVECVRFSPDGRWLASCGTDETIRLWEVDSGDCLQIFRAPGPYDGMNITGATGISLAQKAVLKALGAVGT